VVIRVETDGEGGSVADGREQEAFARSKAFFDVLDKRNLEKVKTVLPTDKFLLLIELAELVAVVERG
jgi:hypothetical protein